MKTIGIIILVIIAAGVLAGLYYFSNKITPIKTPALTSTVEDNMVRVTRPKPNDLVRSPLSIEGEARGNWYFEASFPIRIIDDNGKQLGIIPAQAQGNWMTTEFVPFKARLIFTKPTTSLGTLILEKDNPSGLSQNADERRIRVRFNADADNTNIQNINGENFFKAKLNKAALQKSY